ncbi:hypothetical protein AB6A40_008919 [Gnathostoma spinigerum]|uniref:Uncharacterized protein n=1 Tax=Gnathostoma spinigerum TaxID=75299 RepID=A0ABD6ERN3_9BILA
MLARLIFCIFFIIYAQHAYSEDETTGVRSKRQFGLALPFGGFGGYGYPFGGYDSFGGLGYGYPFADFGYPLGGFGGWW